MIPVILSGGSGTRMWPYSRAMYPKQFLPLVNEKTMLQNTVSRLEDCEASSALIGAPIVVCNEDHRFMVAEQLRAIGVVSNGILLEPVGKNTAPAIALAALHAVKGSKDPLLLILPADHVIENVDVFHSAIDRASEAAKTGKLVTFGIVPTYAETGYGYIKSTVATTEHEEGDASAVTDFLEKPEKEIAEEYVTSGEHFWNSGMFVFKASVYLKYLEDEQPQIVAACKKAYEGSSEDLDFIRVDKTTFSQSPSDSIDYAVMEPASKLGEVVVVPLDAGWNDVGSWFSLWEVCEKDEAGNSIRGDVLLHDTKDSYIQGEGKLISAVGLRDTVIVQTDDSVMVAAKDKVQDVKAIVNLLKAQNRPEKDFHRKVYRPWGYYDSIDFGDRFQVKRLVVNPGAKLSVQMHHHRAEHWVVVSGTAEVHNGGKDFLLQENESTYIPIGATHSLANPGAIPLEIIEVQSGSYLGEDDIVRFEDKYGRL